MLLFLKIYLPIFFMLYIATAFVWPTYKTWKQTGVNPITFSNKDTAHDYIGLVMKLMIGGLFLMILVFSFINKIYNYLLPVYYIQAIWLKIIGLILIHLALSWIIIAQQQMSNSWRIGIDEKNKTALVTHGVFGISRNPIFLGMILTVLGLFLILPNALSFCLTLSTYFIIQIQVRLEEAFLEERHGADYLSYKKTVKRFL